MISSFLFSTRSIPDITVSFLFPSTVSHTDEAENSISAPQLFPRPCYSTALFTLSQFPPRPSRGLDFSSARIFKERRASVYQEVDPVICSHTRAGRFRGELLAQTFIPLFTQCAQSRRGFGSCFKGSAHTGLAHEQVEQTATGGSGQYRIQLQRAIWYLFCFHSLHVWLPGIIAGWLLWDKYLQKHFEMSKIIKHTYFFKSG